MSFEKYMNLYKDDSTDGGLVLKPRKKEQEFTFAMSPKDGKSYKLFVTGNAEMFYMWRDEPDGPMQYRTIVDSLDTEHSNIAQYCLNVSREQSAGIWRAYKKVMWKPNLSYLALTPVGEEWTMGIWACAKDLKFQEGGYLKISFEVHAKKEGVCSNDPASPIVKTSVINLSEGTYEWTKLTDSFTISEEETGFVGVWIEGYHYTGEVYLERPFLTNFKGFNVLPDFAMPVPDKQAFDWCGQGLSKKEWVNLCVKFNETVIHQGEIFDRTHMFAEWELDIPTELIKEQNTVSFQLLSDYHDALPYRIREISLIEQPGKLINVIATQRAVKAHSKGYILVKTLQENLEVSVHYLNKNISGASSVQLKEKGLHVIQVESKEPCRNAKVQLTSGDCQVECAFEEIVYKEDDNVITGTGDLIYINDNKEDFEEFLSWYVSNNVGSLITLRPSYRWSGIHGLNLPLYKDMVRIFQELDMKYALMVDGRDVVDFTSNPSTEDLQGENFLGRQNHERDGQIFYWVAGPKNKNLYSEQLFELGARACDSDLAHCSIHNDSRTFEYVNNQIWGGNPPYLAKDMKSAFNFWVQRLSDCREMGDVTRHTGPTVQYRLFAAAGYRFVGAETMYSSYDMQLSFLRGTAKAYNLKSIGVHHALQWSSSPFDHIQHSYRYRLANYLSYMQDVNELNTEEGLWHMEEGYVHFHRFSQALEEHTQQQQEFNHFVNTHTRSGKFYTPIAFLHGAYDSFHGFGYYRPWGWEERCGESQSSWDLLQVIYPTSKPGVPLYRHDCPRDQDIGYFSGTPLGCIDTLPVESDVSVLNNYKFAAFAGYNCAEEKNIATLTQYVQNGGTLMLTLAHLTTTTNYDDIMNYKLTFNNHLSFGILKGDMRMIGDTVDGKNVEICAKIKEPDSVIKYSDRGNIVACVYKMGKGKIIFFNTKVYPANSAIKDLYEEVFRAECAEVVGKEPVWAKTGNDVTFTVYNQQDESKHIYFLAIDWFNEVNKLREAQLIVGKDSYPISLPFGVLVKGVVNHGTAVICNGENGEVLRVDKDSCVVQGAGEVTFTVCRNGVMTTHTLSFNDDVVKTITF